MNEDNYQKQQAIKEGIKAKINNEVKELLSKQFYDSTKVWEKKTIIDITREQGYTELPLTFAGALK